MGSETLYEEIIVCEDSSMCHPPMKMKALSCKEVICEHDPETLPFFLGLKLISCSVVKRRADATQ